MRARQRQERADRLACPPEQWRQFDNVFRDPLGRPLFPESVTKRFAVLVRESGLSPIRLHDVRHSHATAALAAGVNIEIVADRLGHSTSAVTRAIYLHPVEELDRQAADTVAELILGRPVRTTDVPQQESKR